MSNYNKVMLMGRLTRDIELKYTTSNQPVANIGLAINHYWTSREGEKKEETTFVDCEAWGRTAEIMNQYLAKGRPVFVEGRLKLDQWQDKDGGNRSKLKVVVDSFQFIDSREGGRSGGSDGSGGGERVAAGATHSGGGAGGAGGSGAPPSQGAQHQPIDDDDIPF